MQCSPHVVGKYTVLWETMKRAGSDAVSDLEWEINLHPFSRDRYKSFQYPNRELSGNDLQYMESVSPQMPVRNALTVYGTHERFNFTTSMTVLEYVLQEGHARGCMGSFGAPRCCRLPWTFQWHLTLPGLIMKLMTVTCVWLNPCACSPGAQVYWL